MKTHKSTDSERGREIEKNKKEREREEHKNIMTQSLLSYE